MTCLKNTCLCSFLLRYTWSCLNSIISRCSMVLVNTMISYMYFMAAETVKLSKLEKKLRVCLMCWYSRVHPKFQIQSSNLRDGKWRRKNDSAYLNPLCHCIHVNLSLVLFVVKRLRQVHSVLQVCKLVFLKE